MWKVYNNRMNSYRCTRCTCYSAPYCKNSVSLLLSRVGIEGRYSCNWTTLYKSLDWAHLLKSNMGNIIVMKREYVEEILDGIDEDRGNDYPQYVDKVYQFPLPQAYIDGRGNTDDCINIIVYPE